MKTFLSAEAYIRDLLWIRNKAGKVIPFVPNHVQKLIRRRKREAIQQGRKWRFLIPKARRMGVTTKEQADSFALCANHSGQRCLTLASTTDQTRTIFKMATLFYDKLPEEFQPDREHANRQALIFQNPSSEFFIGTAGATAMSRGDTLQRVHGSEVAYWLKGRDQHETEVLITGLTEAASHGEVTLESTSNGNTGWWAETVLEAWNGGTNDGNEWTVIFLPWWEDPSYRVPVTMESIEEIRDSLTDRERLLMEEKGLDWAQIAWRRAKTAERSMRRLFLQEYPEFLEESFLAREDCFFDADLLSHIAESVEEPNNEGDGVGVWVPPQEDRRYVIGADVAEGVPGGDWSAAYVLDYETAEVCARIHRRCRPEIFGQQLAKLGTYYNGALVGPERNNHGHLTCHELYAHCGYPNLFFERTAKLDRASRAKPSSTIKRGWGTDAITRPILLDDLREALEDGFAPRCGKFSTEAKTFEDDGSGKFQARSGCHDDTIMAMGIALQIRNRAPAAPSVSFA